VAKDTLKSTGEDQRKPGTFTGSAAKGYAEQECDGSEFTKYGNRIDYNKLASHTFK
jgi:hypothetical protein